MSDLFKSPIKEQSAQEIADHLPQGRAWDLKNDPDSNLRKLIRSLAASYNSVEQKIEELNYELDVNKTLALLSEWEKSVLLPDSCLGDVDDLTERRNLVITRLQRTTTVTLQEFQDILDAFFPASKVTVYPGVEYFSLENTFEFTFFSDLINEKFILVLEIPFSSEAFEYDFEFQFENGLDEDKIICFIREFLPANVYPLIVNKVPL